MKRNRPPDDECERRGEAELIRSRLDELFAHCQQNQRQVSLCNQAFWIPDKRHAKIVPNVRITPSDMVQYSSHIGYHYLKPYEALYCLDTNQIIIYFNDMPLSLAEAYQLIIENKVQYREYKVLQQLTRTGYICIDPACTRVNNVVDSDERGSQKAEISSSSSEVDEQNQLGEHFALDSITSPPNNDDLKRLQKLGPKTGATPLVEGCEIQDITFDAYRRESFAKNKPQGASRPGRPDYHVIVCDVESQKPPSANMLLCYSKLVNIASNKLLFALVDDDSSIFFAQFHELHSLSPETLPTRTYLKHA